MEFENISLYLLGTNIISAIILKDNKFPSRHKKTMSQKTYPLPLTFEQILNLVLQLPEQEQEELIEQIQKNSPKNQEEDLLTVFDRIGRNAQAKGLTEEILSELLADES